ncbi:uncharacterized protein [Antedon mediterranea]|uniref:uncharacterized protein isoform X1 n=1 Tax=Antedon mediterranea TaxID=105859 RepID=UPI003AF579A4
MANPELAKLQAQLRKEIQNHQYVVGRLKREPFNADLRKQLNEQQMKIQALSDRQKWVVQDLRNELVKHEEAVVGKMGTQTVNNSRPLTSRSNNQQHKAQVPKLSSGSFKLLPSPASSSQRSSHHTSSSHHSSHYGNPSRMSIMTNSPIKVPTFTTVRLTSGGNKRATSPTVIQDPYKSVASNLHTAKKILRQQQQQQQQLQQQASANEVKKADPESQKVDFMAALDLITPGMAEKLQRKRSERKRRTTANPQFSNYAKYEQVANLRRKSEGSVENGMPADKRRRGMCWKMARPRYILPKPCSISLLPKETSLVSQVIVNEEFVGIGPTQSSLLDYFNGEFDSSYKIAQGFLQEAKSECTRASIVPRVKRKRKVAMTAPISKNRKPDVPKVRKRKPIMIGPPLKTEILPYSQDGKQKKCLVDSSSKMYALQSHTEGRQLRLIAPKDKHHCPNMDIPPCISEEPQSPQDGKKMRSSWTIQEKVTAVESFRNDDDIGAILKRYNCSRTSLIRWNRAYDTLLQHNNLNAAARRMPKPDDHGMHVYQQLTNLYNNEEEIHNVLIKTVAVEEASKLNLKNFRPTQAWIRQWKKKYRF